MNNNDIKMAQVEAGERAVVERLRSKGLLAPDAPTTTPDFTEQTVTPEQIVLGTARLDSRFRKWLIEQLTAMGDGQLQWEPPPQYIADFTEQAQIVMFGADYDEVAIRNAVGNDYCNLLLKRIASGLAEAATQGQVISDTLREALRGAAIEAHVGFNHPRRWADCDLAVCSERKRLIGDCNE